MKLIAFVFILAAGISLSYMAVKERSQKLSELKRAFDFIKKVRFEIENFRTPMEEILENFLRENPNDTYFSGAAVCDIPNVIDSLCRDGGVSEKFMEKIMEESYEEALSELKTLDSHIDSLIKERQNDFDRFKQAKAIFPIAAALLIGILLI